MFTSRRKEEKETCHICFNDTDVEQMFKVDGCKHRYCFTCMKHQVEVELLRGKIPRCPHRTCGSLLKISSARKYLTPELLDKMQARKEEDSVPVTERLYCPYPRCSALMSRTKVLKEGFGICFRGKEPFGARKCIKCGGLFCINCSVPWHHKMTCAEYRRSNPRPNREEAKLKALAAVNSWRQCVKCKHVIEMVDGCGHMTCRCGYEFCYTCGGEWGIDEPLCQCEAALMYGANMLYYNPRQRR